jgi:subtilisin family serine protease
VSSAVSSLSARHIKKISGKNIHLLQLPPHLSLQEMLVSLRVNPDVLWAEPNFIYRAAVTPNDPYFIHQYALYNPGGTISIPGSPQGKTRADIKAAEGWEETYGDPEVVIAVVDTGIDLRHPDLAEKMVSGGRDFINDDFDATDDNGHGTQVAGIAAAATNNRVGISGVAWNCSLLPIKALDNNAQGTSAELIQAVDFAVQYDEGRGVDVICISAAGYGDSELLREALQIAFSKGIVIAAAAGNNSGQVAYPAAYDDFCLAVASTDFNDQRSAFSNQGPEVDVAAPGENVYSCYPTHLTPSDRIPYIFSSGTSLAAAHVAGLAALIKSLKPWLNNREIMAVIRYGAEDVNEDTLPGQDDSIGFGRIDMEKSLVPIKLTTSK